MFQLRHFISQIHPRFGSLRTRRDRRLNAIKPSASNRLWYAQQLDHHILTRLRTAGIDVAHALRNHWPPPPAADHRARDAETPEDPRPLQVTSAVDRARHAFPNVGGFAIDLATKVVAKNLSTVDDRLSASIASSLPGIDIRQNLRVTGPILNEMDRVQRENVELITSIPDQYFDELEDTIAESWNAGERWEELAPRIREVAEMTENRSAFIARDQTSKMNCHFNRVRQTSLGIKKGEWETAGDGDVRESHAAMEGVEYEWDDPPLVDGEPLLPGEDFNCLPGDSEIPFAYGVEKAYRRWYSGELTTLVTDSGKTLRATPNHPVLTLRGWQPIGSIHEGDYVIEVAEKVLDPLEKHEHQRVPLIAEIFAAAEKAGIGETFDLRAADFHGDGSDGDVDIVFTARPLFFGLAGVPSSTTHQSSMSSDGVGEFSLSEPAQAGLGQRLLFDLFLAARSSANSIVRSLRESLALGWRRVLHPLKHAFAATPDGYTRIQEDTAHAGARDSKFSRYREFADARGVVRHDFRLVNAESIGRWMTGTVRFGGADSDLTEAPGNVVFAEPDGGSDLPIRLPSAQKASRVLKASTIDGWEGHVYNLQTESGWYVTNGILTHNCRCTGAPKLDLDDEPEDLDEPDEEESDEEDEVEDEED